MRNLVFFPLLILAINSFSYGNNDNKNRPYTSSEIENLSNKIFNYLTAEDIRNRDFYQVSDELFEEVIKVSKDDSWGVLSELLQNQEARFQETIDDLSKELDKVITQRSEDIEIKENEIKVRYTIFEEIMRNKLRESANGIKNARWIIGGIAVVTAYILLRKTMRWELQSKTSRTSSERFSPSGGYETAEPTRRAAEHSWGLMISDSRYIYYSGTKAGPGPISFGKRFKNSGWQSSKTTNNSKVRTLNSDTTLGGTRESLEQTTTIYGNQVLKDTVIATEAVFLAGAGFLGYKVFEVQIPEDREQPDQ